MAIIRTEIVFAIIVLAVVIVSCSFLTGFNLAKSIYKEDDR